MGYGGQRGLVVQGKTAIQTQTYVDRQALVHVDRQVQFYRQL